MEPVDLLAFVSTEMNSTTVTLALLVVFLVLLYWKRSRMPSNGWRRAGKNGWEEKDMIPYEFEVGCSRLTSSMFGKVEAGGKELNQDVCWEQGMGQWLCACVDKVKSTALERIVPFS
ncbi:hypothetical protein llap_10119 [Limosa lapponica baueri]|uniref:Uncharacterized protein n=1 Tax=Limosa lapponica baueri TaxID=1758121 RepID=A0A2I0U0J8_LIMLA|nr:hypothetical protein llap_10119 [Limosa lapponica baueri]